ncbi:MAG: hypothetical protein IJ214_05470 [Clostridia bacterium]|nr:hypothetical protein [Clostridia bacterium]
MKLTFLGTGAGEGYPGFWCTCPHCAYARQHGGKNVRGYSAASIDGQVLLDCGPTAFPNASRFGVDLTQVHTLLMTHPHEDHLLPLQLLWRAADDSAMSLPFEKMTQRGGARFTPIQPLHVYGNSFTREAFARAYSPELMEKNRLTFTLVHEGESFTSHGYRVTPVRGNHVKPGFAHSYIIEKDGRSLLYALDSGSFDADQMALLAEHTYNLVVMEGTYGINDAGDMNHMSLKRNLAMLDFFRQKGCCAPDFRFYLTHMSPHWCPPHDQYEPAVSGLGLSVAWDGLEIEV